MIADVDPDDASRSEAEEVHIRRYWHAIFVKLSASQSRTPERLCLRLSSSIENIFADHNAICTNVYEMSGGGRSWR